MPGVESVALAEDVPLGLSRGSWEIVDPAGYVPKPNEDMRVYRNRVSPGYLNVMRIPLLAGREFNAADRRGRPVVAIVNETFARRYFGMTEAIGRLIPGVVGNPDSLVEESHEDGLLEYPSYTKPAEWRGLAVPPVLMGGNHGAIAAWRRDQQLERTRRVRPDLLG